MSQLTNNLNSILSIKADIKSAIEAKGVDMTGVSFPGYASKIGEIQGGGSGDFELLLTQGESTSMRNISNSASFVGSYAFYRSPTVQTVTLPNCDYIGSYAFYSCSTLQTISLPVCKSVYNSAFYNCTSISEVNLPVCEYIETDAFRSCTSLLRVDLPECSHLDMSVFRDCTSLSSVNIPKCSYVDVNAFSNCASLTTIDLPSCKSILYYAFHNCVSLSSVNLPKCELIGSGAFDTCYTLTSINLPKCEFIDRDAFRYCYNLTRINLPVCSMISGFAFNDISLLSITLGSSSMVILSSNSQFKAGANISIYVPSSLYTQYITDTKWMSYSSYIVEPFVWYSSNGLLGGSATEMSRADWESLGISGADIRRISSPNFGSFSAGTFKSCTNLTQAYIPNWQETESEVFMGCTSLNAVSAGGAIRMIGGDTRGLFSGCNNFSSTTFVFSSLGDYMFAGTALTSSKFDADTNHIGDYVFQGCTSLTKIYLTDMSSVVSAGSSIFDGCTNLSVIYIKNEGYKTAQGWSEYSSLMSTTEETLSFENGLLYGQTPYIDSASWLALGITTTDIISISLPLCEYVASSTFIRCYNLQNVSLPNCSIVESCAFQYCSSLTSIYLPECKSIGQSGINNCRNLPSIYLPKCEYLDRGAFMAGSSLSTIVLPVCSYISSSALRVMSNTTNYTINLYLGYSAVVDTPGPGSTIMLTLPRKNIYVRSSLIEEYEQHPVWGVINNVTWYNYEDSPYYTDD